MFELFCVQNWSRLADRPDEDPYRTSTAPAFLIVDPPDTMSSSGTPIARSSYPSPSKSPKANEAPKWSPDSAWSLTLVESWVQNWLPVVSSRCGAVDEP